MRRYPISFGPWYAVLSSCLGLPPRTAYVDVDDASVEVRMGWVWRSRFPRSAIASVSIVQMRPLSRGAHGCGGRWLVNGSGRGIVRIELRPGQRGRVLGVPVRLRELFVSVTESAALRATLASAP